MVSAGAPPGVPLSAVIERFELEVLTDGGVDLASRMVTSPEVNRPGLQWAGYDQDFPGERIQLIGQAELGYLISLPDEQRWSRLEAYAERSVPAVIVTRALGVSRTALAMGDRNGVPVLRTSMVTSDFAGALNRYLALELAPREVLHAGLVDVAGEGVLILGRSGIGKSEVALELIRRGHRLVADDTVEVRRPSERDLVGRAPGLVRHFMEVKGIGIVNLRTMYGVGSVKEIGTISMVVRLERDPTLPSFTQRIPIIRPGAPPPSQPPSPPPSTASEETGPMPGLRMEILGVQLPQVTIYVRPERSTAILIETAAMDQRAARLDPERHVVGGRV